MISFPFYHFNCVCVCLVVILEFVHLNNDDEVHATMNTKGWQDQRTERRAECGVE